MFSDLEKKIKQKKITIGIVGLGYVGLPLVKKFLQSGCKKIFGVDNDKKKIRLLQNGKSPIESLKIKYFQKNYSQISTSYSILSNSTPDKLLNEFKKFNINVSTENNVWTLNE